MSKKLIRQLEDAIQYSQGYRAGLMNMNSPKEREKLEEKQYKTELGYCKRLDELLAKRKKAR